MNTLSIEPVRRPFNKLVRVPGSKSITNRALPLAAMAHGASTLRGVLFADDTLQMINALKTLGYAPGVDEANKSVTIHGHGAAIPNRKADLFCGNSGTTIRFLAAMCSIAEGDYVLDGIPRMRQRPIDQLAAALTTLGKQISYEGRSGFPPVRIHGPALAGGTCRFSDAKSSQYISAILMAAPLARRDVTVRLEGPITSEPYVQMTIRMMEQFGVSVKIAQGQNTRDILIPSGQSYAGRVYTIEPDASNASYFLAAAAICAGSQVTIEDLGSESLQGDVKVAEVLARMGAAVTIEPNRTTVQGTGQLHGIDVDMNHIPDMVQTIAVVALFAQGQTVIRNVWNLRVKETDRLAALETELRKLGATVSTTRDSITIDPPITPKAASIATYDDHRMAMAFGVAGLRIPGVIIEDPACTGKTYPEYFTDLKAAVAL
jgi:3-phosphoshikimate 1-carboxyvinyltransferase